MGSSPDLNAVPKQVPDNKGRETLDALSQLVFDTADGTSTVADLGTFCGLDGEMVGNIVGELVERGYLLLTEAPPATVVPSEVPGEATISEVPEEAAPPEDPAQTAAITDFAERLDDLCKQIDDLNHYELLGVLPDAGRDDFRAAFFTMSKKYHPDRIFARSNPDLKKKMELVFGRLSLAYELLTNPSEKATYDASIADDLEMMRLGASLVAAARASREPLSPRSEIRIEPKASQPPGRAASAPSGRVSRPAPSPVNSRPPAAPKRSSATPPQGERRESNVVKVERISKPSSKAPARRASRVSDRVKVERLPSKTKRDRPAVKPRKTTSSPDLKQDGLGERRKAWARQRAGRAMSKMMQHRSSVSPPVSRVDALLTEVRIAMERERFIEANRVLEILLEAEPDNAEAKELREKCEAGMRHLAVQNHLRQGRLALKHGEYESARQFLEAAVRAEPENVDARHLLADALLASKRDLPRALNLAQHVISLGGHKARYYDTLGQLLYLNKDIHKAEEAFAKAVELDPDNRDYKKRLKSCQG